MLLKECQDYAPILAFWSHREWYKNRSIDLDLVIKSYQSRINEFSLPITWVAIDGKKPLGMVTLKENDLWTRKDLNPWLSSLYVSPEFQNRGIGSSLIEKVIDKSKNLGFIKLYLFTTNTSTPNLNNFYIVRDWKFLDVTDDNDNRKAKIYYLTL